MAVDIRAATGGSARGVHHDLSIRLPHHAYQVSFRPPPAAHDAGPLWLGGRHRARTQDCGEPSEAGAVAGSASGRTTLGGTAGSLTSGAAAAADCLASLRARSSSAACDSLRMSIRQPVSFA